MKKLVASLSALLTLCLLLSGCGSAKQTTNEPSAPSKENSDMNESVSQSTPALPEESPSAPAQSPSKEESSTPAPSADTELRDLRVVLSSDIHCTNLQEWYGVSFRTRMQHWVDTILKEHEEAPIDLLIINGDISLDYWVYGGSVLEKGKGTAQIFVRDFLSQLPDDLPVFILPGNHEQYADSDWYSITNNHRQGHLTLGGRLFIFLDTFGGNLDPKENHDGVYTGADTAYIEELMNTYPQMDVYLVAHYFDTDGESAAFKKLVAQNDRIKALFAGHTHKSGVISLGADWGNKTIAQTGNFAYFKDSASQSFWGFRELIITEESAYSQYVIAESEATIDGVKTTFDRKILNQAGYYGELPPLPEEDDPMAGYITLYDKIVKESISGDEGVKESNRLELALDGKTDTKWCVLPTAADGSVTLMFELTEALTIDGYALATANDHLSRSPKAWTLYGKNDPEGEWVEITAVSDAVLPQELYTVSEIFKIENPQAFKYYKMTFTQNGGAEHYQFSELVLLQKK